MPLAVINLPYADFALPLLLFFAAAGLVALCLGGNWLTDGAAGISLNLSLNPVVVGLTVVSIATSMPEFVTSLLAARESPGLAVGNIVGSNIANVGLILGVAAIIAPVLVQLRLIRREVPILIGISLLFSFFAWNGFTRIEGLVLLVLAGVYLTYLVRWAKAEPTEVEGEFAEEVQHGRHSNLRHAVFFLGGSIALALGADLLVGTSVEMALRLGVSDTLIGLTLVAVGTSLPELAASIAAARAGHSDICVGNVVGSNIFNMLLVGGMVAAIVPIPVEPSLFRFELPCMVALTVLLLRVLKTGNIVTRREGVSLLGIYILILGVSAYLQTHLTP